MLSNQEAFEKVCIHLFNQGQQAKTGGNSGCQYRTDTGLKCAVGCLIPDERYRSHFEISSINDIQAQVPEMYGVDIGLLRDLQIVHDSPDSWTTNNRMKDRLRQVAEIRDLNTDILNDLSFKDRL